MSDKPRISMGEFFFECATICKSRDGAYKGAWRYMTLEELASGIRLKAGRINGLLKVNGDREKVLDDLKDLVNYCYFLYTKLRENDSDV